jgi:hypothetical protein
MASDNTIAHELSGRTFALHARSSAVEPIGFSRAVSIRATRSREAVIVSVTCSWRLLAGQPYLDPLAAVSRVRDR